MSKDKPANSADSPRGKAKTKRRQRAPNAAPTGKAMFFQRSGTTLADNLYRELHDAIIAMDRLPGSPLSENEIAAEMGVSRTPVREAILRLSDERLVEVVPKSGTFVARIPISTLPQAQVARQALEDATVRAAARRARESDILALRAIIARQREIVDSEDNSIYHIYDEELHATIAKTAGLSGIWEFVVHIKAQIDRCRKLTLEDPDRKHIATNEHEQVVEAIAQNDEEKASEAMRIHLRALLQFDLPAIYEKYPSYFIDDVNIKKSL